VGTYLHLKEPRLWSGKSLTAHAIETSIVSVCALGRLGMKSSPNEGSSKTEMPGPEGHRERLRARFEKNGLDSFADYEVVELVLTLAIPRGDVKPLAKTLIARFGNLHGILDASPDELRTVSGVGSVTPIALRVLRAVATLYLQQSAELCESAGEPEMMHRFWRARLGELQHEVFEVGFLDSSNRLMREGVERLEEGTVDRAAVYPRRVMEAALRRQAAALVFAHNHPNGDVRPSEQDKTLTRALVLAAAALQIKVIDHLVVSSSAVFSFRKEGLL
jgi:DNA repair protein RadC